jgi:hypothetical protein
MKNKSLKRIFGITVTFLMALIIMHGAVHAQDSDPKTNARHDRIVGVWNIQNSLLTCDTGAQIGGFSALHKYELGGTGQVVPATNPAALSAHMMVWKWVQDNDYQFAVKLFRFNTVTGSATAFTVIRANVTLNDDATEYTGSGRAETFDLNGNPLPVPPVICPSFTGTRFQ